MYHDVCRRKYSSVVPVAYDCNCMSCTAVLQQFEITVDYELSICVLKMI